MKTSSVQLKGYDCFSGYAGLKSFKPLTLILGRNNVGKSRFLELVSTFSRTKLKDLELEYRSSGVLDEAFLRTIFRDDQSGGKLSPSSARFNSTYSHWNFLGRYYEGLHVEWTGVAHATTLQLDHPDDAAESYRGEAEKAIARELSSLSTPFSGKKFCRVLADRDITPEPASDDLAMAPNGAGATNLIRRVILSATLPEQLIQEQLLGALNAIFGPDGSFRELTVRTHDSEDGDLWEVFLAEPAKGLVSLSRSGSGLKTIILTLLTVLVIPVLEEVGPSNCVFAFEELENNLHPALLRRLLRYLVDFVAANQTYLFLTSHSSVTLDFISSLDDSQVVQVTHDGKFASARTIAAHFDHIQLLSELGARPSDLLQANGVIWLEGPSDRIYLSRFIEHFSNGSLREGRDYQCAFYGGSILANSTFVAPSDATEDLANLLRLNGNVAIVCDGDRTGPGSRLKKRVSRIKKEIEDIPSAFLWITDAKEIEIYVPGTVWSEVYKKTLPDPTKFDSFPSTDLTSEVYVRKHAGKRSFNKCDFASKACPFLTRENLRGRFELEEKMLELVELIRSWNE